MIRSRWRLMLVAMQTVYTALHLLRILVPHGPNRPRGYRLASHPSTLFTRALRRIHKTSPFTQLTGHVNDLSNIYEHAAFAIRRLHDEKQDLLSRVDQLEQDNPSAEVRRLRDENSILRARLATAAREKAEVIRERDTLFRKLHGIRQLIDGPAVRQAQLVIFDILTSTTARSSLFRRSLMR